MMWASIAIDHPHEVRHENGTDDARRRLGKGLDSLSGKLHTTRSAFTRTALREAIAKYNVARLEEKHRKGYERQPAGKDEFAVWDTEQAWVTK